MQTQRASNNAALVRAAMERHDVPELAIRSFVYHLDKVAQGASGTLSRDVMTEVGELPGADEVAVSAASGSALLSKVAVLKLNGGLGTSMGLKGPKSLLKVREGLSFLDLTARQIMSLRESSGQQLPLILMNSNHTDSETRAALAAFAGLELPGLPLCVVQNWVPKLEATTMTPVSWPQAPELAWCPPGHGDLLITLKTSGMLELLLERGIEVVFCSNIDNLGAVLDPAMLGFMVDNGIDFIMEVAQRTVADRKGGHLCRLNNGRFALRERSQCPGRELDEFQDIERYRYFNTNNIWLHLPSLARLLEGPDDVPKLATIINHKTVDPRDPASPRVVQLETAVGAAIELFPHAAAVRVGRHRFSPVKTTGDLLAVRSDAYVLQEDARVVLSQDRQSPPDVDLDQDYYRLVDDFEERFAAGVPSLVRCEQLKVEGDVHFGADVVITGRSRISAGGSPLRIPDGMVVDKELDPQAVARARGDTGHP